jgi:isopenicillin N synthase-like dioxygenase
MTDIPIIDVSGLRSDDIADRNAVAAELGAACRNVGFFYVTGHGIPPAIATGIFDAARTLFALPGPAKDALSIKRSPHNRGYVGIAAERLDETASPDQKEAFNIGLELPPDDPELLAGKPFRGVNLWPDLPGWRDRVLGYYDACMALQLAIHRGFALDLGVSEDFFADKMDRPIATLRLLHYPEQPANPSPGEKGCGAHTDWGAITFLLQDDAGGLQVRGPDGWIDAAPVPGSFVVNLGDMMERWTNGRYRSTMHRVINTSGRPRISIPFFFDGPPAYEVACLPTCLRDGELPQFPPITVGEHLAEMVRRTYA